MILGEFKKLLTICGYAPQGAGSNATPYNPANVAITGGTIDGVSHVNTTGDINAGGNVNVKGTLSSTSNTQPAGVTNSGVALGGGPNYAIVALYDQTQSANNRTQEIVSLSGAMQLRFKNDAGNAATPWLAASGGYAAGVTGITSTSGSGAWAHTGSFGVTQTGGNGVTFVPAANGSIPAITSDGANSNVSLNVNTKGGGGINLNSSTAITGPLSITGALTNAGGVISDSGSKSGASIVTKVFALVTQAANVTSQTLYSVPAGQDGTYRVSLYAEVTQAATTSSTLPNVGLGWTGRDSNTAVALPTATPTNPANALGALGNSTQNISCKGGTNITIQTSNYASSGATPMQYAVRAVVEYLGA